MSQTLKRSRKRRVRSRPQMFKTINSLSLKSGDLAFVTQKELEIVADRNFKPIWFKVSATSSSNPSLLQVRLYGPDGKSCFTSDVKLVPVGTTVSIRVRWPRSTDWFSENLPSTNIVSIRSPCLSKKQTGGILSLLTHCAVIFGPDIDDRSCAVVPDGNFSRLSLEDVRDGLGHSSAGAAPSAE